FYLPCLGAMALPSTQQHQGTLTRRMALGAGFGLAALALATTGASAQVLQTKNTAAPGLLAGPAGLEKHCDDIKDVFQLAKFTGEYRHRVDAFVASRCAGAIPLPRQGDFYNTRRFNTSAGILQNGGGIVIAPSL